MFERLSETATETPGHRAERVAPRPATPADQHAREERRECKRSEAVACIPAFFMGAARRIRGGVRRVGVCSLRSDLGASVTLWSTFVGDDAPKLLESVYRDCIIIEMTWKHLRVVGERHVPLVYKGHRIDHPIDT